MTTTATDDVTTEIIAAEDAHVAHNYHPLPVVLANAEGAWMTDVDGRRFLDLLAGYRFEGCEQVFGGVLLWAGTSFLYEVGLVRATMPPEPHDPTSRGSVWDVHPLSGGWYLVTVSS